MRAYVINLARSLDRRAHITAELTKTGLDFEIVTDVDERDLNLNDSTIIDPSLITRWTFPEGTAGCALSHQRVYQKIIADGADVALVLEDDVTLPHDLGDLIDAGACHLTGAEVALLNHGSFPPEPLKISLEGSIYRPRDDSRCLSTCTS